MNTLTDRPIHGPKEKKTILLVDDHANIQRSMMRVLGSEYAFKTADNGREGLATYLQGGIDLVISDREMPEMGGLQMLKEIRKNNPQAKVIVMSGGMSPAEMEAFSQAGAVAILEKPFDFTVLRNAVASALRDNHFSAPPMTEPIRKNLNVLLVDDDADSRYPVSEALQALGHSVTTAENGLDALGSFLAGRFDLVISDLHMPMMDGSELLVELRKKHTIPVIILSAHVSPSEARQMMNAGASAVLQRPIGFAQLEAAINAIKY